MKQKITISQCLGNNKSINKSNNTLNNTLIIQSI